MSALKKLPHRDWERLRDLWIDHLPQIDFSDEFPEPTLWHLEEVREKLKGAESGTEVPYIEGTRESVFREAVLLTRKFSYCRQMSVGANRHGFPAWSIIAQYDACFFGAKAFCYLLGIASVDRHSKLYLDMFTPRIHKVGKKKLQVYDVLAVHKLDNNLTHSVLWSLIGRLGRTLTMPEDAGALLRQLKATDFSDVSYFRNKLIYDGGFWHNSDDIDHCDLNHRMSHLALNGDSIAHITPESAQRCFSVAQVVGDALLYFFADLAKLAPKMAAEVDALAGWRSSSI